MKVLMAQNLPLAKVEQGTKHFVYCLIFQRGKSNGRESEAAESSEESDVSFSDKIQVSIENLHHHYF